jgi:hypothetical protein
MIDKLIPLIGKRIDSEDVKSLFNEWKIVFPKKITCTPNNSSMGNCKLKKDGLSIEFGLGGHGKLLKPVPKTKLNYIGLVLFIEIDEKYAGLLPFDINYNTSEAELTKVLGTPKETNFMNVLSKIWRKEYKEDYEVLVNIETVEGKPEKKMRIQCKWDDNLELLTDYEKAGL